METNQKFDLPQWLVITFAVSLSALIVMMAIAQIYNFSKNFTSTAKPQNTISVSADGKVEATPDLATVSVGVLSTAKTAAAASSDNNKNTTDVIKFIKLQGIQSKDIATTGFSVYPQYDYANGRNNITGYQASQTVTVKVHGVDKSTDTLNNILGGSVLAGSNQIQGVNLSFEDPDNLKQEARTQAIAKAKTKAQELADQTGLKLVKIVSIAEGSISTPVPMPYAMGMGGGADVKSAPSIETGSQDVIVSITVTFEVK